MQLNRALIVAVLVVPSALAGNRMPVAQQNALVEKYCTVCHTDAAKNGGLSLEHFDAANAAPSLAAMMLSKLSGGTSIATVQAAPFDPAAAALLSHSMKTGAMGAAGLPIPDQPTIDAFIQAFASESTGASEWSVNRDTEVTASILRELPATGNPGLASLYRLVLNCNPTTHEGEMQLAWSPLPKTGTLLVTIDFNSPKTYKVEGLETMGNGSKVTAGPASITLYKPSQSAPGPLPSNVLRIENFVPGESVEFPFASLGPASRNSLAACFSH